MHLPLNLRYSRAFSLIESAIVLAVVGLVIGGIWVAASAVNRERTLNRTVEIIGIMNENFKTATKDIPRTPNKVDMLYYTGCTSSAGYTTYNCLPAAFNAQIVPADAIASDGNIRFPLKTTSVVSYFGIYDGLNFDIGGVAVKDCIALTTRLASRFAGKISLAVEEAATQIAEIGVRPANALADATAACTEPGYDDVTVFINFPN